MRLFFTAMLLTLIVWQQPAWSAIDGAVSGTVEDSDHIAVSAAKVQLLTTDGKLVKETSSDMTGNFNIFPVSFGTYQVVIKAAGYHDYVADAVVSSGAAVKIEALLLKGENGGEMVLNVKVQRKLVQPSASGSKKDITQAQIAELPGGSTSSLTKVISETTPGVVQGPTGQTFIRGNHANIQYQVDGVQLPDSMSGTFGDAFSTRNVDHMEVITGGIPAEYGERMAAVVNIITKTGPEEGSGELELNYGSYRTLNPSVNYGGSDKSGKFHYFLAGSALWTDRGIDTPQPESESQQKQGGEDTIHDQAFGNDEFAHFDYYLDNTDKISLNLFNEMRTYHMPTYPSSFQPTDPYFSSNYTDQFGNNTSQNGPPAQPLFVWTPPATSDSQFEQNSYIEGVWKKTLSERSFLQVTPYFKKSSIKFDNDPSNDLASAPPVIAGAQPVSFAMDRSVDNTGLKVDYSSRFNDRNLVKTGFQVQYSQTFGSFSTENPGQAVSTFATPDSGGIEAVYAQDSFTMNPKTVLNAGLRYTAIQFNSPDAPYTSDGLLQPRIGLEYMVTEQTKLHAFYGRLFTPAPFENLRAAFLASNPSASPYDLKGEKDDYYEGGVSQQINESQVASLTYYYKDATDMLDDTQIPGTAIDQPYNFARGFATGVEFSISGEITSHLSEFFNYSYENAQGNGIGGGFFAFTTPPQSPGYQYLDHCQLDTANFGLTYKTDRYWTTLRGLYGSGLRTGSDNSISLPEHYSFDATYGYIFSGDSWASKWKVSVDVTNITDNAYPIFIANGFNGSHYAAGREYFLRVVKNL